ncbi:MAG: threonine--tRNA ligase, partial [Candidatus Eremiobacterota bacterium]
MATEDKAADPLYCRRHSLAHVMAQAMQKLYPGTHLGFGPPVENGFYYDFELPRPVSSEDLPAIEQEMRRIL